MAAVALLTLGAISAQAATSAPPPPRIVTRPLTPNEVTAYALGSSAQLASGLNTVGIGQPAYLDCEVANAAAAGVTNVAWQLTTPLGSTATLQPSTLGTNVPIWSRSDALVLKLVSRMMLRPDVEGAYTVTATVSSATNTVVLTKTVTGGRYLGWTQGCAACHSGGLLAPDMTSFTNTPHATAFARKIDDGTGHFSANCISCHALGYDKNPAAVNGGFDDVALQLGWTFPTVLTNGNWAAMPDALKNVSNIQCENCHGPGSQHVYSGGVLGNTNAISISMESDNCSICHDAPTHHIKSTEWYSSLHAVTTRTPTGAGRTYCVRCHSPRGFAARMEGEPPPTDLSYSPIGCATCHDPHDASNPHQLRTPEAVLLADGVTTVTNAGAGTICMNCHRSRNGSVTNSIVNYPLGLQTWDGGSGFGPHDNPASDMFEGVNGWTYGKSIPSAAHRFAVKDACAGCHMQTVGTTDPAFLKAGGHTMNMTYNVVANGVTNTVDKVDVCIQCHGTIDSFDMQKMDYNGDGVIEGVQTEVQHLLDKLSTMLPGSAYVASGNYVADGLVKSNPSVKTNWPAKFLEAAYNFQFVNNDKSKGVHNAPYAVGLLKASIADLTGDANSDGLPDAWQIQYFGSATAPNAAPNAMPAGDGIPNWLKYSMGVDPTIPGMVVPGGVVWANAGKIGGSTNTIHIYTAAEVAFDTEVGKTYQLQSISTINGTWSNVGTPIQGTGSSMSLVTPTRTNPTQYFRVITQ